jgi:hypothetical protein
MFFGAVVCACFGASASEFADFLPIRESRKFVCKRRIFITGGMKIHQQCSFTILEGRSWQPSVIPVPEFMILKVYLLWAYRGIILRVMPVVAHDTNLSENVG